MPSPQSELIGSSSGVDRWFSSGTVQGGWLAANTALILARRGEVQVDRLVLVNPMITPRPPRTGSRHDYATGLFANTADFDSAWQLTGPWVNGDVHPGDDPSALAAMPPTILITNEADSVRDEGEAFAENLSQAGVSVLNFRVRGLFHVAWPFPNALPEAALVLDLIAGSIGTGSTP